MQEPLNGQNENPKTRGERKALKYKSEIDGFDLKSKSQIRTGIVTERSCTNMFCLVLFLATILVMVGLTWVGFNQGDVQKLIAGVDGDHNICGTGEAAGFPNLYLTDINKSTYIKEIF
jgi:hypothetical protein